MPSQRFSHFTKKVRQFQREFGLLDWELFVVQDASEENRGWCTTDIQGKMCFIGIDIEFMEDKHTSLKEIEKVAFHEVLELLLSELGHECSRFASDDSVEHHTHNVIRRIENFHFGSEYLD
jgi:hypothetical protein